MCVNVSKIYRPTYQAMCVKCANLSLSDLFFYIKKGGYINHNMSQEKSTSHVLTYN